MNILIIPSFFHSKKDPTLGSFVYEQAIALAKAGNKVYILFSDTYSLKYINDYLSYDEESIVYDQGIVIYREKLLCPLKHKNGLNGCNEAFAKSISRLYFKYLSDCQIDIIHAHCCAWAGYAAKYLSCITHLPYIITEHSTMFELHKNDIGKKNNQLLKDTFRSARKIICVSKSLQNSLQRYSTNSVILGNVINCELFKPDSMTKNNNFTFLTVCYMRDLDQIKKKGIDILIKSFSIIAKTDPSVKLVIGGGGSGLEIIKQWVKNLNILDKVILLGALERDQVAEAMRKCDVFVLPSRYETFGVVYAEAMSCGKPVIATRTGGPDSFINDTNGIIVDIENERQLVDAMEYMIHNINVFDPMIIRKQIVANFSMKAIAQQLCDIYREYGDIV